MRRVLKVTSYIIMMLILLGGIARGPDERISEIHATKGVTLIIVTHNERLAAGMGKTIRLVDGRIE